MDRRLPRYRRILSRKDFLRIQSQGKKSRSKYFVLSVCDRSSNQSEEPSFGSRIGVTITKKVNKRAVYRNKLRRRVKEVFRFVRGDFTRSVDIVVIALSGATELSYWDVRRELHRLLHRAKVLPNKSGKQRGRK